MGEAMAKWSELFTDMNYKFPTELQGVELKKFACAEGLTAWGLVQTGNKPPEHFGRGMVKISEVLQISATPTELSKYADLLISKK